MCAVVGSTMMSSNNKSKVNRFSAVMAAVGEVLLRAKYWYSGQCSWLTTSEALVSIFLTIS